MIRDGCGWLGMIGGGWGWLHVLVKPIFLVKNVSFRATMSKLFFFRYNSSSLRFDLTLWQFQNMFIPMKTDIRYLS